MGLPDEVKIFAGSGGQAFAERMVRHLGNKLGLSDVRKFSDGNLFVRIGESVRGKDVFLVQPIALNPNDEFTEILFWMDAFKRASVHSVTAVIPYFGYAKGDKKDEARVSIRARVCAEAIELAGADRVICMDLHAPQIQGFFKKPLDHLSAQPVMTEFIRRQKLTNPILVSPDLGFLKPTRRYSEELGLAMAVGDKVRRGHDEKAEVLEIIGEVRGHDCVIVDDFTISGGTLTDLARGLKDRGAGRILAVLSHNLIREQGIAKIEASPIEVVAATDSVANPFVTGHPKFVTVTAAPLFAEAVRRIHSRESVSSLFEADEKTISRCFEIV